MPIHMGVSEKLEIMTFKFVSKSELPRLHKPKFVVSQSVISPQIAGW
jgi:hypothetical protein